MVLHTTTLMLSFLSLLLFNIYCSGGTSNTYYVNSSFDLEQYLCNTSWSSQYLVLLLNSSVIFTIPSGNFCQVSYETGRIEIRSDSSTESAIIRCNKNDTLDTNQQIRRGLIFFNSTVILQQLVFKNCGTYLTTIQNETITDYLNSSSLYYTSSHAAALVFVHCQINITQVNIYYSYGFAMIGTNLYNSIISRVNISNSTLNFTDLYHHTEHNRRTIGCGVLLHFFDHQLMMYPTYVIVNNANFKNNFDLHQVHITNFPYDIVTAAGLTVLYTQKSYFANVSINNTEFISNKGSSSSPGGLLVFHYNSSLNSSTIINNSLFSDNANGPNSFLHGAGLALYWIKVTDLSMTQSQLLLIQNTKFYNHTGHGHNYLPTGAVYVHVDELDKTLNIDIHFKNCNFQNNLAQKTGACLFVSVPDNTKNISIVLEDVYAKENSQNLAFKQDSTAGIFSFINILNVSITGMSVFTNNYGSVIDAVNSNVYLSKYANVTFSNNVGSRGAAIKLLGNGYLYFIGEAVVNFTNNHAQEFGGAIYASSSIENRLLPKQQCIIQLLNIPKQTNISFANNVANRAGSSIYAYPLFSCQIEQTVFNNQALLEFYQNHFHFIENKNAQKVHNISTSASKLTFCYNNNTFRKIKSIYTYSGRTINVSMASIDAQSRKVYSSVAASMVNGNMLHHYNREQVTNEGDNCTEFSIVIISKVPNTTNYKSSIAFSIPSVPDALIVNVTMQHCPLGFVWDDHKHQCFCSSAFFNKDFYSVYNYKAECDINYLSIIRPSLTVNTWAGYVNASTRFGVSMQCPIGYCNYNGSFFCSSLTNSMNISNSRTCDKKKDFLQSLCAHHREGPLCGSCGRIKEGQKLSVVFGSTECKQCNNWWLWTLVLYAVVGPLLIYMLYALRLTLITGTLNGIIFYAQMANCGITDLLALNVYEVPYAKFCLIFVSIVNLNLGFPLCFYNGMTEVWKAGLSLLFPLYLLTIVVILIILSRFSLRLASRIAHSSVQVLVTVVHLSFSKLLLAIIDVFTSARIYYDSNTSYNVWYWDGSVDYGVGSHLILMIITLLIVIPLLLPYILLLLFARPIRRTRINEYVRPLLEAIHAPYKEGKEYWFVIQLLFVVVMYIIYVTLRASNILKIIVVITPFLILLLLLQTYFKPFKNEGIYFLNCCPLLNLIFLYTTTWFLFIGFKHKTIAMFVSITVIIVFLMFLAVFLYHILLVTGKMSSITAMFHLMQDKYNQRIFTYKPLLQASSSQYDSCEYREPLLSSSS